MMGTRQVLLLLLLLVGIAHGLYVRYPRDIAGGGYSGSGGGYTGSGGGYSGSGGGGGAYSSASSFSSSSGTNVNPGPGGYGNFNAFSGMSSFPSGPGYGGGGGLNRGGEGGGGGVGLGMQSPFSFPGFNPFVPQYGQQYPYTPFPLIPAPFDFSSFLNQYFQNLQHFQAQAQQAAQSGNGVYESGPGYSVWAYHYPRSPLFVPVSGGYPLDTNEVGGGGIGGIATATYSPQGGYGSANVYPAPAGALDNRFGGDDGQAPQNSVGAGGPVGSVSANFPPPGGSSYGVFTSSVSGSSDINGKKSGFKQSTIGVNDNGKVTTYTSHDP